MDSPMSSSLQIGAVDGRGQAVQGLEVAGERIVQAALQHFADDGVAQPGTQFGRQALGRTAGSPGREERICRMESVQARSERGTSARNSSRSATLATPGEPR